MLVRIFANLKHNLKNIVLTFFAFFFLFSLASCQTKDTSNSRFVTDISYTCEYDEATDTTIVKWKSMMENNSIYSMSGFEISFDLYENSRKVDTKIFSYSIPIKYGETELLNCKFDVDGKIDAIKLDKWSGNYQGLWDSYKWWWIITIVVVAAATLIYIIVMIVEDLELWEVFDFLEDHLYLLLILLPLIGSGVWSAIVENWVPTLIIGGGLLSLILLILIAHLIKFIFTDLFDFSLGFSSFSTGKGEINEEDFDPSTESVEDYINDGEKLMLFRVSDLKEYCREKEIKGFSSLNKDELVELIMNYKEETKETDMLEKTKTENGKSIKKQNVKNSITFEDIAGLEIAKEAFKEKVILPFEHPELFEKFGKKAGGGILLYGLPGTGKTMFAEAASNELNALFIPVKCSDIKSKWYGESEQKVKNIFSKARKADRAIIFFDEFEAIGAKRTETENGNNDLVPQILAEMQGVGSSKSKSTIMVIAATNKPWSIDSAFMRPGRFDEKIYIPLPDFEARKRLFELQLTKLPTEELDFEYLANITEGFNGADIKEVCEKLKMSAIKESLANGEEHKIGMSDVHKIEHTIKSTVSLEDIENLEDFEKGLI